MEVFGKSSGTSKRILNRQEERPDGFDQIRGARLLLVEDNEINQQVAKEILETEGFYVDIADDGKIGVDKIQKNGDYDLILMDLQMPVMDGYEATLAIRKNRNFNELPIVAMTADAMVGVRDQVKKVGMNDYVTKPINQKDLWKALTKWIIPGERTLPESFKNKSNNDKGIEIPIISGIDIENGLKRVAGNKILYINLLEQLRDNYRSTVIDIQKSLENDQRDVAIRLAHSLKSVSGNMGAETVQLNAGIVELALKENRENEELLNNLDRELQKIIENISLENLNSGESKTDSVLKEEIDHETMANLLKDMKLALEKRKPKIVVESINELNRFLLPEELKLEIDAISSLTGKYKFKDALSVLNNLDL